MFRKEIKSMLRNKVYAFLLVLPFGLAWFMSEGTKGYLASFQESTVTGAVGLEYVLYTGPTLSAQAQFAISELSFMLMLVSIVLGLNILEERRLHIWDRVQAKGRFLLVKFGLHYLYSVLLILGSVLLYSLFFELKLSLKAVALLASLPLISLSLGSLAGLLISNRTVVSNSLMMLVMIFGYFGGALSLSSVLATTPYMRYLIYLSPLSLLNKLVFMDYLGLASGSLSLVWILLLVLVTGLTIGVIRRRLNHDTIL